MSEKSKMDTNGIDDIDLESILNEIDAYEEEMDNLFEKYDK